MEETTSDKLKKEVKLLAENFEKAGVDFVVIANYGDGNGGMNYDFKGDEKTMLPAIIVEAARSSQAFRDAILLAAKSIKLIESNRVKWPTSN